MGVIGLVLAIGPNWSRCAMRSKLAVLADCYRSMSGLLSLLGAYTSLWLCCNRYMSGLPLVCYVYIGQQQRIRWLLITVTSNKHSMSTTRCDELQWSWVFRMARYSGLRGGSVEYSVLQCGSGVLHHSTCEYRYYTFNNSKSAVS